MRRAQRLFVVAAGACVLVACNLIAGFESEYRVGGTDSGTSSETSNPDGPNPEGSTDGPVGNDGGPDAPKDGSTDGPAGVDCKTFDAGATGYCWDFEDPAVGPSWGWSDNSQVGGSLGVEPGIGFNGTKGLRAKVTNTNGGANVFLRKDLGVDQFDSFDHQEFAFSCKVVARTGVFYGAAVGVLSVGLATKYTGVTNYGGAEGGAFDISDPPGGLTGASQPAQPGRWYRVRIKLDRSTPGPFTTQTYVDDLEGAPQLVDTRSFSAVAGNGQIYVGVFFTSTENGGSLEVVIDDVTVTRRN